MHFKFINELNRNIVKSKILRQQFLDYFASNEHVIVKSAPMVIKDDPTLMFTNAGMNPFKDIFQGNKEITDNRVANSQKCLRVSGKHNDLEEVGKDTYHHTMFEMLGNWSFGDYFKKEAIDFAWNFLTKELGIDKDSLYVSIFEGNKKDGVDRDTEAYDIWLNHVPAEKIIDGNSKDNFWEMGETGPCGPCSEIHVDIRSAEDKKKISGRDLVNEDHPLVIEVWNLVFVQYLRKADRSLEKLPKQHVDTGMGFERLCMVTQGVQSNYDTDLFQPLIQNIEYLSGKKYNATEELNIAMRVIADHLRAIAFSIADGQLPSNNKAGYVIRRILRRAVRYGYSFLGFTEPFICKLVPILIDIMGDAFIELKAQQELISNVIKKEEESFLKTLETGLKLLDNIIVDTKKKNLTCISGKETFELYDTFGFPLDLTELILEENKLSANIDEFNTEMQKQKDRSRQAAKQTVDDWITVNDIAIEGFVGYDNIEDNIKIVKYRKVEANKKSFYQIIFNKSPFYAESGGQIGDSGYIELNGNKTSITDTKKEANATIHYSKNIPTELNGTFKAVVNKAKRDKISANHSATHIIHQALREVLGSHVEQKGSFVNDSSLRFDFSHFQKVTKEEIVKAEILANSLIRANNSLIENRAISIEDAQKEGAIALFSEKYSDTVRTIRFGDSIELCGGTHVSSTGNIGLIKITSESSVSAGIRRIEAITSERAELFISEQLDTLDEIKAIIKTPKNVPAAIEKLLEENATLKKRLDSLNQEKLQILSNELLKNASVNSGTKIICEKITIDSTDSLKNLAFKLKNSGENIIAILCANSDNKPVISVVISEDIVNNNKLHAGQIVKNLAKEIKGGGGGQPFFATAGGKDLSGLDNALAKAKEFCDCLSL